MTREEAKEVLKEQIDKYGQEYDEPGIEALEIAIKALSAEPCEDVVCHTNLKENAELIAKILDADACGEVFIDKIKKEIDEQTEIHADGEFYVKNIDVKRIIGKYKESEDKE